MDSTIDDNRKRVGMITFFEQNPAPFFPLTHVKKTQDLRSGIYTAHERLRMKAELLGTSIIASETLIDADLTAAERDIAYAAGGDFIFALTDRPLRDLEQREFEAFFIRAAYPWDYVHCVGEMIARDYELFLEKNDRYSLSELPSGVTCVGDRNKLFIHTSAEILPGVVFDTREGVIVVDAKAKIRPFSFIEGPAYIGTSSLIDGAKIRPATAIGPVCKIAGEVENSIFHSYSNKHHDGFIGHAYIGSWVNLGAMTTNSDLKNNYGEVVVHQDPFSQVYTGSIKIGCFIGDHVKTGIGTLLTTGAVVGTGSCLFGGGMYPKHVPAFSWASSSFWDEYSIDKCCANEAIVMKRRGITLDEEYQAHLRRVFLATQKDREEGKKAWEH